MNTGRAGGTVIVKHIALVVVAIAVAIATGIALPAAASDLSGEYGPLSVFIDGDRVTGTFFDARGEPDSSGVPPFTCIFLLKGKLDGTRASIVSWVPGDTATIPGELKFAGGQALLSLKENQAGCATTGDDMTGDPFTETLSTRADHWIGVGMVSARRAVLQPMPAASPRRKPYLVQYDPVVILERKPGWVRVVYDGEKPVTGWLAQSDLAFDEPPKEP
ncbi:MAG TPA: hypothetical protein VL899_09010 [Alphaproteobacteria bacterium]|jgi:hypothetical protein|nr:hypothetical protein [Alphaproteobacteria bacterium]